MRTFESEPRKKWTLGVPDSPDVVYTVREGLPEEPEILRYSLRSLKNVPHGKVFVSGHKPIWASDQVIHLPTTQMETPSEDGNGKFHNIGMNLEAALLDTRVSDNFYWFNDDMFIMKRIHSIPLYARQYTTDEFCQRLKLAADPEHNAFVWGCWTQRDMLIKLGYDTENLNFTDCHYPMPVNKQDALIWLKWMSMNYPKHPLGHFRAVVGASYPSVRIKDCKIQDDQTSIPDDWKYASTYSVSWNGIAGRQIRTAFPEMCKYETYDD